MLRLDPYINASLRRFGRQVALRDAAASVTVLEPETPTTTSAAVALDGEFERVRALAPGSDMDRARALVHGGPGVKRPLVRYEFEDALVYPTGFSVGGGNFMRDMPLPHKDLFAGKVTTLPKAFSTHSPVSIRYFGHWIADSCPTALLKSDDDALLMTHRADWPHAQEYCRLFDLRPEPSGIYRVEKLTWMDDVGQGESRARRYEELRRRLRDKIASDKPVSTHIYLRRGATGARRELGNENELVERLAANGFAIVDIENASVADIMRKCMNAEVCVTMDGSHQNHALFFLRKSGLLMIIQPADRFALTGLQRAPAFGMQGSFVVADAAEGGYQLDPDRILRTLDLWRARTAA